MFTGLITALGKIEDITEFDGGKTLTVIASYPLSACEIGASIAHNGVCLTVTHAQQIDGKSTRYTVDAAPETLEKTTLNSWQVGDSLNLETALKLGDPMGGHMVLGHVDGMATIQKTTDKGTSRRFDVELPQWAEPYIVPKGSITLDGTSLTINTVVGNTLSVLIIPHTLSVTNWHTKTEGEKINFEVDYLARFFVEHIYKSKEQNA